MKTVLTCKLLRNRLLTQLYRQIVSMNESSLTFQITQHTQNDSKRSERCKVPSYEIGVKLRHR